MDTRIAQRLATLQAEQQQTQQAMARLEQERQGLLQQLIGQTYAVEVLQGLLAEPEPEPPAFVTYDPARGIPTPPMPWETVAP